MILTLHITTPSVERTFLVLRRIKSYLRLKPIIENHDVINVDKDFLYEMMQISLFYEKIIGKLAVIIDRRISLPYR